MKNTHATFKAADFENKMCCQLMSTTTSNLGKVNMRHFGKTTLTYFEKLLVRCLKGKEHYFLTMKPMLYLTPSCFGLIFLNQII